MSTTTINGIQFTITRLPVAHGARSNRWANQIKSGSTRAGAKSGALSQVR